MSGYEAMDSFGGELGDALADLNDTFSGLEGLDALAGATQFIVPVVLGGGLAFGTVAALDYFVTDEETKASVLPYKWLIGLGIGLAGGAAMYKFKGPTEGVITMASAVVVALAGWGIGKLAEPAAEGMRAAGRYLPRSAPSALGRGKGNLGSYVPSSPKTALGSGGSGGSYGRYATAPWGNMVM